MLVCNFSKQLSDSVNTVQMLVGFFSLVLGAVFYIIDRSPNTYFIWLSGLDINKINLNCFGLIGDVFADFVHTYAFILLTCGFLSCGKKGLLWITIGWLGFDLLMETGQYYPQMFVTLVPKWFDTVPFFENTQNFFRYGTFDPADIVAIICGAIMGYCTAFILNKK
jgi:hypothetical protein